MKQQFFAFIRAINTGGRRLTNDEVTAPFERLGLEDVAAYQAAGNVSFRTDDADGLERRLEETLGEAYEFEAPTFVRTSQEMSDIVRSAPFSEAELAATDGKVQVAFLRSAPDAAAIADAAALVPEPDRATTVGREWFWLPQAGISTSDMPVTKIEKVLGPMTIRTLGTLERMLKKFA